MTVRDFSPPALPFALQQCLPAFRVYVHHKAAPASRTIYFGLAGPSPHADRDEREKDKYEPQHPTLIAEKRNAESHPSNKNQKPKATATATQREGCAEQGRPKRLPAAGLLGISPFVTTFLTLAYHQPSGAFVLGRGNWIGLNRRAAVGAELGTRRELPTAGRAEMEAGIYAHSHSGIQIAQEIVCQLLATGQEQLLFYAGYFPRKETQRCTRAPYPLEKTTSRETLVNPAGHVDVNLAGPAVIVLLNGCNVPCRHPGIVFLGAEARRRAARRPRRSRGATRRRRMAIYRPGRSRGTNDSLHGLLSDRGG